MNLSIHAAAVVVLVVDSMAKIPSGILDGQLMWTASYFMCTNIEGTYTYTNRTDNSSEVRDVLGKHCRMPFQLSQVSQPAMCMYFIY